MSLYAERLFPRLCDWAVSRPAFSDLRRRLLAGAAGEVIEPGFGTGRNLAHYPAAVTRLAAVEPNPGMRALAAGRARAAAFPVAVAEGSAERLPFPDASFDTAVLTWTLCSVDDPAAALAELRRVLRPGGRLLVCEHGLCPGPWAAWLQRGLTPVQRRLACGCRLDRPVRALVEAAGFRFESVEESAMPGAPRVLGWTTFGTARV